jgi:hypothetical protein
MSTVLRIGTWNLERSGAKHPRRIARQVEEMVKRKADIWVLTETHDRVVIPGYHHVSSEPSPDPPADDEHCVAIWSRYPLRKVPTEDAVATVAAEVDLPHPDQPLLVYGTIITYGHDGVAEKQARAWERHRAAVAQQAAEWGELAGPARRLMCVAGDFNENLDGTRWYGVKDAKEAILRGVAAAGMVCLTTDDLRSAPFHDIGRASVDHICFTKLDGLRQRLEAWPGSKPGEHLSDHNGVLVELHFAPDKFRA